MAASVQPSDDWVPVAPPASAQKVAPVTSGDDDWVPAGKSAAKPKAMPITPGQSQFERDKALIEEAGGYGPLKAGSYAALNTFLLNAPSHVVAGATALSKGKSYDESFKEQKEFEEALSRQHPTASMVGTATGLGASLLTPIGVGGAAMKGAALLPRMATSAGIGAGLAGTAGYLEHRDIGEGVRSALLGAGLGAAGEAVIPKIASWLSKSPQVFDSAGKPTQETLKVIQDAFGGRIKPEDATVFLKKYEELSKKAVSPEAAMREALLAERGVEAPTRSMTTGQKPTALASDVRNASQAQAERSLVSGAEELAAKATPAGSAPPVFNEVAQRYADTAFSRQENRTAAYNTLRNTKGEFDPQIADMFVPYIESHIQSRGLPDFQNTTRFPLAKDALNYIKGSIVGKSEYPYSTEGLTLKNIDAINAELNARWASASSADRVAIDAIKNGLNDAVSDAFRTGMFSGNSAKAEAALQRARSEWSDFAKTFYPDSKIGVAGQQVNTISKKLADNISGRFSQNADEAAIDAAQKVIDSSLVNPKIGSGFYDRLEKVFGSGSQEMSMVNRNVMDAILDVGGDASRLPRNIDSFLERNSALSQKIFTPDEISELKRISEAVKTINASTAPDSRKASFLGDLMVGLKTGIGPLLFAHLHNGSGIVSGATYLGTAAVGTAGSALARKTPGFLEAKGSQKFGAAPEWSKTFADYLGSIPLGGPTQARAIGTLEREPQALETTKRESGYSEPTFVPYQAPPLTIRPGRKSGGSVSISDRLISEVQQAKRNIDGKTKTLLGAHDDHVAHALSIANKNLEG